MRKLLMVIAVVMLFGVGTANALIIGYEVAPCGTKDFTTAAGVVPGGTICLDIYLTGVTASQNAGGVWIDFSGSLADIIIVSAGRCMQDGSEGCTGPWTSGVGANISNPGGPGTHMLVVGNQGGVAPDGDGDLIVGTITLQNTGPNDATVNFITIPGVTTWTPLPDTAVGAGVIVVSQLIDDEDEDGIPDAEDNCPETPNGPNGGTCTAGESHFIKRPCLNNSECGIDGFCSMNQEDTDADGIGDACEICEGDLDCDDKCDAIDVAIFLEHFGRSQFNRPCTNDDRCPGDFFCDRDVDADDVPKFLECLGRGPFFNPCLPYDCGPWCIYP